MNLNIARRRNKQMTFSGQKKNSGRIRVKLCLQVITSVVLVANTFDLDQA